MQPADLDSFTEEHLVLQVDAHESSKKERMTCHTINTL
jgi:hypothetical protein